MQTNEEASHKSLNQRNAMNLETQEMHIKKTSKILEKKLGMDQEKGEIADVGEFLFGLDGLF